MLSYRRETVLQGALQFSPKVEDWNGRQYFTDIIGLSSTIIGLKFCRIPWKNAK